MARSVPPSNSISNSISSSASPRRIQIRVKPGAKVPGIQINAQGALTVSVSARAEGGRANEAVVAALADYYDVPKRAVRIVHGMMSRQKVVEIG